VNPLPFAGCHFGDGVISEAQAPLDERSQRRSSIASSLRQRPVAYELRYTDLLRPIQQAILARRAALYFPLPLPAGDPQFFSVFATTLETIRPPIYRA
jgi:hypothetical protein